MCLSVVLLSFIFDVGTFFICMFVSMFVLFGARRPISDLPLAAACHCFLVQLMSHPPASLSRSVWNVVLTNVQATVKNYMSLNYDWLRFSGSAQEDHIMPRYKLGFHEGTGRILFTRWMDSRRVPPALEFPSNEPFPC